MISDAVSLPGESAAVRRLRELSDDLVRRCVVASNRAGSDIELVLGLPAMVARLTEIAPTATHCSWVLQPRYSYDPEDPGLELSRAARARGVVTELITLPSTVRTHPLLSSIYPETRLGPVFARALVVDEREAMIGGPDDAEGNRTSWHTRDPDLVQRAVELWRETVPLCSPILPDGVSAPLTERQLEVARMMCVGEKDLLIARQFGLSERTVEREVSAVLRILGATSRTEAVLLMRGRGVNGGWSV